MAASLNLVPSQHLTLTPKMRADASGAPALHFGTVPEDQRCLEDNPLLEICESSEEVSEAIHRKATKSLLERRRRRP